MKLSVALLVAATLSAIASAVSDNNEPLLSKVHPGGSDELPAVVANSKAVTTKADGNGTSPPQTSSTVELSKLPQKTYGSEYHMPFVRVVQARVQSDKPEWMNGRFVSTFGNGDFAASYRAAMDTVNMASVEGALLYVQAEGVNYNTRAETERCVRKKNITYVVLYEILIAQPNETLAQIDSEPSNVPEYGPMVAMDDGACTPLEGVDNFPPECLQFNGDKDQPALGPYVGAGGKNDDVRAPYPNAIWFSFPNTCPLTPWSNKKDANNACRATTRKGLCDPGQAPDGVACTFAYDILGWVPIDDVVGITSLRDASGKNYSNFQAWCDASKDHIEFKGDERKGGMDEGLPFWEQPLNVTRNSQRASAVIELYQDIVDGAFASSQIPPTDIKHFKALPSPKELAESNPPCYKSVRRCNTGFGCKRSFFSQICMPCQAAAPECKVDASYTLPLLQKASTKLPDKDLSSGSKLGGKNGATGKIGASSTNATAPTPAPSAAAAVGSLSVAVGALLVAIVAAA